MLEFESKKLDIKVNGVKYGLDMPSYGRVKKFRNDSKGLPEEEKGDAFMDLLDGLGLPIEIAEKMSLDDLSVLLDALTNSKKK